MVQQFLDKNNVAAEIHEISGSVEIAPGIGLADAIVDLVSSGSTLFMNGLKEVETVLQSQAVLIRNERLGGGAAGLLEQFLFRIRAVKKARNNKYILLNAPNEKSAGDHPAAAGNEEPDRPAAGRSRAGAACTACLSENDFWDIIEKLKARARRVSWSSRSRK